MRKLMVLAALAAAGCEEARPLADVAAPPIYWQMDDRSSDEGWLLGYTLAAGVLGEPPRTRVVLNAESFAAGPYGDDVLYGDDDGASSRLVLLDARTGVERTLLVSDDVIRRAALDPAGDAIWVFRLQRDTRRDLGVWRVPLADATQRLEDAGALIVEGLAVDPDDEVYGPTFTTELHWSAEGDALAVQSCGEILCRTRVVDPRSGFVRTYDEIGQGELLGFARGALVFYEAGNMLPAAVHVVDARTGARRLLVDEAGLAVVVDDEEGPSLVFEGPLDDGSLYAAPLSGAPPRRLPNRLLPGTAVVGTGPRALARTTPPKGFVVLGVDGRLAEPSRTAVPELVRLQDGALFVVGKE